MTLWTAFKHTARDLFEPRILIFLLLTPIFSLVAWGLIFLLFAWTWVNTLSLWMADSAAFLWLVDFLGVSAGYLPQFFAIVAIVLLFLPITYFSTVMLISIFGMPVIVAVIREKHYPNLTKVGASGIGALWNTLLHSLIFLVLFVVTLPLWLLPGMQVFLPIALTAIYNRRIFTYDALGDFMSHKEILQFKKDNRSDLLLMGVVIGGLAYVPLASFIMPIVGALSFTHYCLGKTNEAAVKSSQSLITH